jgi:hypothetical protein
VAAAEAKRCIVGACHVAFVDANGRLDASWPTLEDGVRAICRYCELCDVRGSGFRCGEKPKQSASGKRLDPRERAVEWLRQLQAGEVSSRAALARREGLSRARVSQVLNQIRGVVAHRRRAG